MQTVQSLLQAARQVTLACNVQKQSVAKKAPKKGSGKANGKGGRGGSSNTRGDESPSSVQSSVLFHSQTSQILPPFLSSNPEMLPPLQGAAKRQSSMANDMTMGDDAEAFAGRL